MQKFKYTSMSPFLLFFQPYKISCNAKGINYIPSYKLDDSTIIHFKIHRDLLYTLSGRKNKFIGINYLSFLLLCILEMMLLASLQYTQKHYAATNRDGAESIIKDVGFPSFTLVANLGIENISHFYKKFHTI
ncbi:hypothetical protein RCL_jg10669.t1 [Rhizophagus clarus]|uniref:Uncharacterized protein n=1 Tax=Rhizophagus clarus TaxID=94130 RepID=A0A8H3LAD8_9GLOM|nr:hypothetical protein RCL_jg10669.t1 [Rhizophagus clarus]